MAISINKVSEEIQQQIIEDYLNNKSLRQIQKDYEVTRQTVAKFLEKKGIKNTKGNHYRKYFHNEDFFETIDSEEKAYWLGMMFADGYIVDNSNNYGQDKVGLSLAEDSLDVLEKFKKAINATNPITWEKRDIGQPMGRLLITSQKMADDLIDKGCFKQKSLLLSPPKISNEFIYDFVRGFFDGDGSLIKTKNSNKTIWGIEFTSTYEMVCWLKDLFGFGSIIKEKRREKTYYFSFGGNKQIEYFYHLLYDKATVWMDRKYKKFQDFLNTLKNGV